MLRRENALIKCPECGKEMSEGGRSKFLLWCADPGEKCTCYFCEACGYIFMPGKRMPHGRAVPRGRDV